MRSLPVAVAALALLGRMSGARADATTVRASLAYVGVDVFHGDQLFAGGGAELELGVRVGPAWWIVRSGWLESVDTEPNGPPPGRLRTGGVAVRLGVAGSEGDPPLYIGEAELRVFVELGAERLHTEWEAGGSVSRAAAVVGGGFNLVGMVGRGNAVSFFVTARAMGAEPAAAGHGWDPGAVFGFGLGWER